MKEFSNDINIREKRPIMYSYGYFHKNEQGKYEFRLQKQKFEVMKIQFYLNPSKKLNGSQIEK